jgi:hypothetical protein
MMSAGWAQVRSNMQIFDAFGTGGVPGLTPFAAAAGFGILAEVTRILAGAFLVAIGYILMGAGEFGAWVLDLMRKTS